MSQSADQGEAREGKYSQILALLSENEQGRHFLDALSSDSMSGNEVALRTRIFALEQQLASRQRKADPFGEEGAACQKILADVLQTLERVVARRKEQVSSLLHIRESLETTARQLKNSGDHSIAGHILSDMAARLVDITEQHSSGDRIEEESVGQLSQLQEILKTVVSGNDPIKGKRGKKSASKKFI